MPLLKDGNMFFSFHVDDPLVRQRFLRMVAADAEYLASVNIMDYSLLLGVSFRIDNSDESDKRGGIMSAETGSQWAHRLECWAGIEVPVDC